jgi:PKD repeat protein
VALCASALTPLLGSSEAGAIVAEIGGRTYGVTPIKGVNPLSIPGAYRSPSAAPAPRASGVPGASAPTNYDAPPLGGGPLLKHFGPVMHEVTTHLIYWDPGGEFTATTTALFKKFFTDVAHDSELATNVFAVTGQYFDEGGSAAYKSAFAGESTDKAAYPASGCAIPAGEFADPGPPYTRCLTDTQLREQLSSFITSEKLPHGPAQQYFVLLPHKVVTCLKAGSCSNNEYCAYHSVIGEGTESEVIYSDIPFSLLDTFFVKGCQDDGNEGLLQRPNGDIAGTNSSTRFGDVALKYTSHEYIEAATDPHLDNWFDFHGLEIGDKCNGVHGAANGIGWDVNSFLPTLGGLAAPGTLFNQSINANHYYLQSEWDNAAAACRMAPLALTGVGFLSAPAAPKVSSPVKFEGAATDAYGGLSFSWSFGDGKEATSAAPVVHTYEAPGTYKVTMTARDPVVGLLAAPVSHTIVVNDLPTAAFTISPNPATTGSPVEFSGKESSDPDGSIAEYSWNFGDGGVGGGVAPAHAYAAPGEYKATLTVKDVGEETVSVSHTVTVKGPPVVVTEAASAVTRTSATLGASVNPAGAEVSECRFEYGASPSYGSSVPCSALPLGSGYGAVAVLAPLTGLSEGTTYHFRIVARNGLGPAQGPDNSFATSTLAHEEAGKQKAAEIPPGPFAPTQFLPAPNSAFTAGNGTFDQTSGVIALTQTVSDPGTFSWLATFQNGKFGVFAASSRCKAGFVRLGGRCRPAKIVFARGSTVAAAPGSVTLKLRPGASAVKALKNALKQGKGVAVTVTLTFQSVRGGGPASHTQLVIVRLKKHK